MQCSQSQVACLSESFVEKRPYFSDPTDIVLVSQVATFAVSALASNNGRMGKPFNPLLGETYQLEQDDFRIFCEQVNHFKICHARTHHPPPYLWKTVLQLEKDREIFTNNSHCPIFSAWLSYLLASDLKVCHHPPVSAFHAEGGENGSDFIFHGSMYPKVKVLLICYSCFWY